MTTVVTPPTHEPIGQVLTPEEYDALPENPLRELVDGVIHMMATPTSRHQYLKIALFNTLFRLVPRRMRVTSEVEVRLADRLRRIPDVLVVRSDGFDLRASSLRPEQVVLVIEVVSPGSETTDRDVKPIQYARAGVLHYWRVETDPEVVVHTYRLGAGPAYVHTGSFGPGTTVAATGLEWASVDVSELAAFVVNED